MRCPAALQQVSRRQRNPGACLLFSPEALLPFRRSGCGGNNQHSTLVLAVAAVTVRTRSCSMLRNWRLRGSVASIAFREMGVKDLEEISSTRNDCPRLRCQQSIHPPHQTVKMCSLQTSPCSSVACVMRVLIISTAYGLHFHQNLCGTLGLSESQRHVEPLGWPAAAPSASMLEDDGVGVFC